MVDHSDVRKIAKGTLYQASQQVLVRRVSGTEDLVRREDLLSFFPHGLIHNRGYRADESDLLYQIYLAQPNAPKSEAPVTVKEVLDNSTMDEFIRWYAKEKLKKLQRGSVKGFIADNGAIKSLNVFDKTRVKEIEKILQIRHLYTHQNGIVDEKFRQHFPASKLHDEHRLTLDDFLAYADYLVRAVEVVDDQARKDFNLALYS